jgi:hypothetical protein
MKKTVNIQVTFEENYQVSNPKYLLLEDIIKAWNKQIYDCVKARLQACQTNLFNNRDRVCQIDQQSIWYATENGSIRHYSEPAANAMQEVLGCIKDRIFCDWSAPMVLQVVKALYWLSPEEREKSYDGISFDDLYSHLLHEIAK